MALINKARNLIYFLVIGWIFFIVEKLREGQKAKQELLVDTYELQKRDIESGVKDEDLDRLIDDTNSKYKPGSGDGSTH